MFVFKKEQKMYDFGGITIGGHPGENPTALIGGLFFKGQPIVKDTREGLFDKALAQEWISTANMMVEKTGLPLIIQAFGRTPTAMPPVPDCSCEPADISSVLEEIALNTEIIS